MGSIKVFLADLAYFNKYSSSMISIPLNVGYIASYLISLYGKEVDVRIFKDPQKLLAASRITPPDVLGLSCYYWNTHLDVLVAKRMKQINPDCVVVIGGPQIDSDIEEQADLHRAFNGALDLMVINEGELGFAKIIEQFLAGGRDQLFRSEIDGCTFFDADYNPICGKDIGLSLNLATLPSPILSGLLDEFLTAEFMPMLQTSRMCPYSCSYCASGKLIGKIRGFSDETVQNEIEYIADKYREHPHRTLFITDENFGVNKRDSLIAEFLAGTKEKFGYPRQTFCYFDKKFSPIVKQCALFFADMNSGGLQLAFQTFNKDALKAVKRRNMSDVEMKDAVIWAHEHGLKTSSELIFGLPYETKQTFLDSLEFIMQLKIDTIAAHNLLLLKGIELNRKKEREHFQLVTKYRPSFAAAYGIIDNEFVCESEELVTSSSHFSFDDFLDIRKISLTFYIVNAMEYFKKVFNFLIEHELKLIPLFDRIMNPLPEHQKLNQYIDFVNDFVRDIHAELFDGHEHVSAYLKELFINNNNDVAAPSRLNVFYASRLIYKESQDNWFGQIVSDFINDIGFDDKKINVLNDLMLISQNEWIDIHNPGLSKTVAVSPETLTYLGLPVPSERASKYLLKMSASEQQRQKIENYNKQYMANDESYYYNVLDIIQPRKQLRFECLEVECPTPEYAAV